MLAVESGRVCNISPENMAAVFGTVLPFTHAEPLVYKIAEGVSPADISAGKTTASNQHMAERSTERDMELNDPDMCELRLSYSRKRLPVNGLVVAGYSRVTASAELSHAPASRPSTGRVTRLSPSIPSTLSRIHRFAR